MTRLRRLNGRGIAAFADYLQQIRDGLEFQPDPALLNVDEYSEAVTPQVEIEKRRFENKFAAAEYLVRKLQGLTTDAGLWSWLALYYFEQLSPKDGEGRRRPRENYHYIPSQTHGWGVDRHLLAGPFNIYLMHGHHARLFLYPQVHEHGRFIYDLGFRHELMSNRGLVEAIDILYWDAKRNRRKRGATTASRPGNLRRLITVLQQLDFNYDLYGMTAREILALLPREFEAWLPVQASLSAARPEV